MAKLSEVELGELLIPWLEHEGWTVYQEVQFRYGGTRADLACLNDKQELWIIELKVTLGLKVIEQAERWDVHYRSVGVPSSRRRTQFPESVCKVFEVGILEIDEVFVRETLRAPLQISGGYAQKNVEERFISELDELHKTYLKAGSKAGGYLTTYRRSMIQIQEFITEHPGCNIQEIYDALGHLHYAHEKSFKSNAQVALKNYEDWCEIKMEPKEQILEHVGYPKSGRIPYVPKETKFYIREEVEDA